MTARVLCVDDDEDIQILVENTLGREPWCEVIQARDGEEALEVAARDKPDIILLDAVMPKKGGWEVGWELKRSPETQSIPVIMISSIDYAAVHRMALDRWVDDYFTKPFDPSALIQKVRGIAERKGLIPPAVPHDATAHDDAEAGLAAAVRAVLSDPEVEALVARKLIEKLKGAA